MRLIKFLSIVWLALTLLTVSSASQPQVPRGPPCMDRAQAIAHLHALFGEQAVGRGLANGGFVLELFVGPSGSWTAFATTPQGLSCLIAAGEGWEPLPKSEIFAGR